MDPCVFHCVFSNPRTEEGAREERLNFRCYVDDLFILSFHNDERSLYSRFTSHLAKDW